MTQTINLLLNHQVIIDLPINQYTMNFKQALSAKANPQWSGWWFQTFFIFHSLTNIFGDDKAPNQWSIVKLWPNPDAIASRCWPRQRVAQVALWWKDLGGFGLWSLGKPHRPGTIYRLRCFFCPRFAYHEFLLQNHEYPYEECCFLMFSRWLKQITDWSMYVFF